MDKVSIEDAVKLVQRSKKPWGLVSKVPAKIQPVASPLARSTKSTFAQECERAIREVMAPNKKA